MQSTWSKEINIAVKKYLIKKQKLCPKSQEILNDKGFYGVDSKVRPQKLDFILELDFN